MSMASLPDRWTLVTLAEDHPHGKEKNLDAGKGDARAFFKRIFSLLDGYFARFLKN
jgi:hypothetical protein